MLTDFENSFTVENSNTK